MTPFCLMDAQRDTATLRAARRTGWGLAFALVLASCGGPKAPVQPSALEEVAPPVQLKPVAIASDRDLEQARQTYLEGGVDQAWEILAPVLERLSPEDASQWENGWVARIALSGGHLTEAARWIENLASSWLSRFDRLWLAREQGEFDLAEAIDLSGDPQWNDQELGDRKLLARWLWQRQEAVPEVVLLHLAPVIQETLTPLGGEWPSADRLHPWIKTLDQNGSAEEVALLAPALLSRSVALGDRMALGQLGKIWKRGEPVANSEEYRQATQALALARPTVLALWLPPQSQWEAAAIEAKGMSRPGGAALEWGGERHFPDRTLCAGTLCQDAQGDVVNLDQLAQAVDEPWVAAARRLSGDHPGDGVVLMLPAAGQEGVEGLVPLLAELREAHIPVEGWYRFEGKDQDPGKVVDDIPIAVPRFPDREVEERFRTRYPLVEGAGIVLMASSEVAKLLVPKLRFSSIDLPVLGIGDWDQLVLDPSDRDAFEGVAFLLPGRDPQEALSGSVAQVVRRAVVGALIQGWQPEEAGWQEWEVPGQGKIEISGGGVRLPYQIFRFKNLTPRPVGTLQMEPQEAAP